MTLYRFALLVLGSVCGSELNIAVFAHPTLNRQPLETLWKSIAEMCVTGCERSD